MDNSEWNRNGDFKPSRFEGQQDAANLICDAKTQQNPESTLGVMSMAGKRPEIHLTQTNDTGRLLQTITKLPIDGYIDLSISVKIAQLSLKHRQDKTQKQRIVVFVGSPLDGLEDKECVKLGKQLRKNDVAIDVVNFGHPENIPLLTALVENCNKNGNSRILEINYGMNIADTLITSPIVAFDPGMDEAMPAEGAPAEGGAQPATGGGQNFAEFGGIDPNLDPEYAMAIRISLEEHKNADKNEQNTGEDKPAEEQANAEAEAPKQEDAVMENAEQPPVQEEQDEGEEDYEAALEEAKRLSMQGVEEPVQETPMETDDNKVGEGLEGVINEEFLGELMQDLGVPMTEDAIQGCLEDDEKKDDKDKKKEDKKDEE